MSKTATRRSSRAKTQKPIETMEDEFEVPEAVQEAAESYTKALTSKNKATAKCTNEKERLIEAMKQNEIEKVRVLLPGGNEKIVRHQLKDAVKIEKPKKQAEEE